MYHVTFRATDATNVEPAFLEESCGEYSLIEVTDACVAYRCDAELSDEHGSVLGHVHADGSYRLTGGCP